jgi:hypothetical protein
MDTGGVAPPPDPKIKQTSSVTPSSDQIIYIADKVVEEARRVFSTLSKHREITLTPSVLQFIENKLREEVYNRRSEIVNFLQQRQMDTAEIDAQITKSVDEIFFSVIAFVVNEKRNEIVPADVEQVLRMLSKLCLNPLPFWIGKSPYV